MAEQDLELTVGIGGEKAFLASLRSMDQAVDRLTQSVDRLDKESVNTGRGVQQMGSSAGGASSMLGSIGLAAAATAAVSAVGALGRAAVDSAMQYESLSISLGVLLGDAEKVPGVLAEWKKFSDATPFEPEQVNKAGKALLAFGFESEQLVPLMTKIGDVAAGTGKDFNELAIIYGKARVAGTLYAEDINQLTEAGIDINKALAVELGTTSDQVKKMGSEGKITFPVFEKAFANLAKSDFPNMMDKLSQSTEGIISTLRGTFDEFLREVGTAFLPVIKELATAAIPAIQNALVNLKPYLAELPKFFASVKETAMSIIDPLISIYDSLNAIVQPLMESMKGFEGFSSILTIGMPKFGLIGDILNIVAKVLGVVADAVTWMNEQWDYLVGNYPTIAKAIEYILLPLNLMISPLETIGGLWNDIFGDGSESVGGLADATKAKLGDLSKYLQSSFGATKDQVLGFAQSFDMAKIAGLSQADAMYEIKKAFGIYIATCDEATTSTTEFGNAASDASKKALPAAGSIAAMEAELKKLQDRFNNVTTQEERNGLHIQITKLQEQIETAKRGFELFTMSGLELRKVSTIMDGIGDASMYGLRDIAPYADAANAAMTELMDSMDTRWERFGMSFPESADIIKQGIKDLGKSFLNFGVQAAESIGYAIGKAGSAADAFKAVINSMLVEVPKLVGMVLLNAAVAAGPTPAGLALGAAGLALIGLSGLLGGIIEKNQEAKSALADSMSDLPTSATGATGAGSIGGLGGYTAASQQQAPVMVNVNAEMDGVQLGGLFKRVTTNYNKTTIKQR